MTAVLTIVAVGLQLVLYPTRFFSEHWVFHELPKVLAVAFSASLLVGAIFEFRRLIGGRVLGSFLLGTYHRPRREERIVMFLDIAGSTTLAEQMGELRVHDLITRFFFDIDRPIVEHDGEVHSYVGDEVIITWPLTEDTRRNAQPLRGFFAVQDTMARLAPAYTREFGVAPHFRAGVHSGPVVVSECGDTKRQIALFGDTMNVAARLCEHSKAAGEALVVSAQVLKNAVIPTGFRVASRETVSLRGRQTPVEAYAVRHDEAIGLR
jgi:class 3 adenylate cyclase